MADVVTRLVVESKEYDSKIARATSGLTQFEKKCREVGGTLEFVEKEDLDFVKALGQMDTVATTATGKLGELKKAFTELSVQYKNLTDEEKKSPYGQALAGSLEQIKGRIGELGGQLSEVGKEIQTSGGLVDRFADSLGQLGPAGQMAGKLLKGAFGPVGIAIAAVVGVIHQLVEAFKRNENAMASAERAAAPFKAIWQGIQRIFDKLVPLIADGIEKISNGIQTMFEKITDWMGKLSNTTFGKKLGLDKVYNELSRVIQVQNQLTQSNKQIADSERELQTLSRSYAEDTARDEQRIAKLRSDASEKDKYNAGDRVRMLEEAAKIEENIMKRNVELKQKELDLIRLKNSLTQSGTEDLNAESAAVVALTNATTEYYNRRRALQKQLQSARGEAAGGAVVEEVGFSFVGNKMTDFEKLQQSLRVKLADSIQSVDINSLSNLMSVAIQHGIDNLNPNFEELQYKIGEGFDIPEEAWIKLQDEINEQLKALNLDPIVLDVKTGGVKTASAEVKDVGKDAKQVRADFVAAASAVSALGGALQQIDDPAAKIAGIVAQAVANIALGFAAATASPATTAAGVFGWIAAATTGLATMISTIAAIKSVTSAGKFAEGGVVGGNSYSGDRLMAYVNSGETILNQRQAQTVLDGLQGAGQQGGSASTPYVSGENIVLGVNNYFGRSGQGEIVTTSMLRRAGINL